MLWLKRNLFLAVGGLITLILIGIGVWYMLNSIQESKSVESALDDKKAQILNLSKKNPFPSQQNINIVKTDIAKMTDATAKMRALFTAVPAQRVIGKDFADLLANTIDELRKKADQLNIGIPSRKYAFGFEAENNKLTFDRRGFPALPEQLAEIRTIVHMLFDAKINRLMGIRRTPVSAEDDSLRTSGDYHDLRITTDPVTGTVVRPYQFEFECFSGELAGALESITKSKYAFQTKLVAVEPVGATTPQGGVTAPVNPLTPPNVPPGGRPFPGRRGMGPAGAAAPPVAGAPRAAAGAAAAAAAGPQELKTVLAEKLLKVVLLVEVIQPGR